MLTFPWNYPEIISRAQGAYPAPNGFWSYWVEHSRAPVCFAQLYREFHQACALPAPALLNKCCEGKLASVVQASVERIHFHGLDIEMANLTIEPTIKVLNVEISHGLDRERANNGSLDDYVVTKSSVMGTSATFYAPANDTRHFLDCFEPDYKPYLVSVTAMIESPMKLYVQN